MVSIELSRVSAEVQRLAKFFESIGLHPSHWKDQLIECEQAAVQKIVHNNRQMVMDFNRAGSDEMAKRWGCSRRTAFRIRDKAKKECHLAESA